VRAGELGDAGAVGEHQARASEGPTHGLLAGGNLPGGVQHVAAVHRDHQGRSSGAQLSRLAHRVARGHRVVRVHEVELEAAPQASHRQRQRRRRPRSPLGV
jgi:hypothetical protein